MAWQYSEKTQQLFMDAVHGKPGTHLGEIENPDGFGEHGSIACGDAMRFTFRVRAASHRPHAGRDHRGPLSDLRLHLGHRRLGGPCTLIEQGGYTPIQALKVQNKDIVEFLGGLPQQKIHCSVMGAEALESAVFNWAQKRGVDLAALGIDMHADEQQEGRIVCKCFSLSEPYIRRKIRELNLHTIAEITHAIKAGGACMACHHVPGGLQDLLNETWGKGHVGRTPGARADQIGPPARRRRSPRPGDLPPTSSARRSNRPSRSTSGPCSARTAATWKSSTSRARLSIAASARGAARAATLQAAETRTLTNARGRSEDAARKWSTERRSA